VIHQLEEKLQVVTLASKVKSLLPQFDVGQIFKGLVVSHA
jgi:hypothetical protein